MAKKGATGLNKMANDFHRFSLLIFLHNSVDLPTTLVTWSSEFKPDGVSEAEAEKEIQDFFQAGVDNLKKIYS